MLVTVVVVVVVGSTTKRNVELLCWLSIRYLLEFQRPVPCPVRLSLWLALVPARVTFPVVLITHQLTEQTRGGNVELALSLTTSPIQCACPLLLGVCQKTVSLLLTISSGYGGQGGTNSLCCSSRRPINDHTKSCCKILRQNSSK